MTIIKRKPFCDEYSIRSLFGLEYATKKSGLCQKNVYAYHRKHSRSLLRHYLLNIRNYMILLSTINVMKQRKRGSLQLVSKAPDR